MNMITIYLFQVLNKEKKGSSDYVIAEYLIHHLSESANITTDSLAEACHVSKASISRFCRNIGLNDFFELRYLLSNYYVEIDNKFKLQTKTKDFVTNYVDDLKIKSNLLTMINRNQLKELVDDLEKYKKVVLMGHMQSGHIAKILQEDLSSLHKIVEFSDDFLVQKEILLNENEETLIIAFSTTGLIFQRILPRHSFAKQNKNHKIYLISTSATKVNEYANVHINLDAESSYISSNIIMLAYANLIALGYKEKISK